MGYLSKIFGKRKSSDQIMLIRQIIGREIVRGHETFECNSIADETLIGLPEATVITLIKKYFDLKWIFPNLTEKGIFKQILFERLFSYQLIDKILDEELDLVKIIRLSLGHKELGEHEDQSKYLSDSQILAYIDKYKDIEKMYR